MMDINVELLQWFIIVFIKEPSCITVKNEIISNKELAEELDKPIIKKFQKGKVHSYLQTISETLIQQICNT